MYICVDTNQLTWAVPDFATTVNFATSGFDLSGENSAATGPTSDVDKSQKRPKDSESTHSSLTSPVASSASGLTTGGSGLLSPLSKSGLVQPETTAEVRFRVVIPEDLMRLDRRPRDNPSLESVLGITGSVPLGGFAALFAQRRTKVSVYN